ncbi:MAG: exodeoxyribonuclease VII large subunit [Gemmataceae bacterium]|nr:exodeoxyribonuclease VII large subunit [Gemmataceae bacterium]MDW8265089.1 exodeoxyribonuclease VII large subunit [Gemmataceae bacterium]
MMPTQQPPVKVLTVTELNLAVKELLEGTFPPLWVAGEISNLSRPASGHMYFTLKDNRSAVRCAMWRSEVLQLRFEPRDGLEVVARGRVGLYEARGDYQFYVAELQPKGVGAAELALRQLKEKLLKLGYFDPKRKKPLPRFPRRVALVTSPTGAAVRDMLEILTQRWPPIEVWVCPVRVQGEGATDDVVGALRLLNRLHGAGWPIDVIIVGRGGGSNEDLDAFNAESVAQALYESRIPVVSAVGHEIDVTIADLVADRRAATPTHAATEVVPNQLELLAWLDDCHRRLRDALDKCLAAARRRLDDLAARRPFRWPLERIHGLGQRLDDWSERLQRAIGQRLEALRVRLDGAGALLESVSPLNVLARGYSLTRREADGLLVRSVDQLQAGDRLVTQVHQGRIVSRVEELSRDGLRGS